MLHTTLIARGGCWGGKAASQGGRVGADGAGVDTRRGISGGRRKITSRRERRITRCSIQNSGGSGCLSVSRCAVESERKLTSCRTQAGIWPGQRHSALSSFKVSISSCTFASFPPGEALTSPILLFPYSPAPPLSCPTYWTSLDATPAGLAHNADSEATYLDSLIVTRAFENECCVAFANVGGMDEEKSVEGWIGRSKVTLPFKGVVGEAVSPLLDSARKSS